MFDRAQLVTIQEALRRAMNSLDNDAAEAARIGDREALSGNVGNRANAYHERAKAFRDKAAEMFALMPMITEAVLASDPNKERNDNG